MSDSSEQTMEYVDPKCGTCIVADFTPNHRKVTKIRLSNGDVAVSLGCDAVDSLRKLFEQERGE